MIRILRDCVDTHQHGRSVVLWATASDLRE